MGTYGCLQIYDEHYPDRMLLHTTHTAMNIPDIIKKAPLLILKQRPYLQSKEAVESAFEHDGTLLDWLFVGPCVASLLMAAHPMLLAPVFGSYTPPGSEDPIRLTLRTFEGEWLVCNVPDGPEGEDKTNFKIHPKQLLMDQLPSEDP